MRQQVSRADSRALSLMLVFVLLLGSVSLSTGVVIVSRPNHAELTVNICQPIQTCDGVPSILIARPSVSASEFVLSFSGSVAVTPSSPIIECKVVPDTPPPEQFA